MPNTIMGREEQIDIKVLQRGDEKEFQKLFRLLFKRLHYMCRQFVDEETGADLVQDAFVKLWERKDVFNSLPAIKSYLYITVRNACLNVIKHNAIVEKHEQMVFSEIDDINKLYQIIESEFYSHIHTAVNKLPVGCRQVIYMSFFENLSNQEIADLLSVSINTVKTQKQRGLKLLKPHLSQLDLLVLLFALYLK